MALAGPVDGLAEAIEDAGRLPVRLHPLVVPRIDALPLRLGQGQHLLAAPQIGRINGHEGLLARRQQDGGRRLHGEVGRMVKHRLVCGWQCGERSNGDLFAIYLCSFFI